MKSRKSYNSLLESLNFLHSTIVKKDTQNIFYYPVTDAIAINYSKIISHPMCFQTMQEKINQHLYNSLYDYLCDLELTFKNAMLYNHPTTIYHKKANSLLCFCYKNYNKSQLKAFLNKNLPSSNDLTLDDYGFVGQHQNSSLFLQNDPKKELEYFGNVELAKDLSTSLKNSDQHLAPEIETNNMKIFKNETQSQNLDKSNPIKLNFICSSAYCYPKPIIKESQYTHAENVIKSKLAMHQNMNKIIKILKSGGIGFNSNGPTFESTGVYLPSRAIQEIIDYTPLKTEAVKQVDKFDAFSNKFEAFTENINDVSLSIIKKVLKDGNSKNIAESDDSNTVKKNINNNTHQTKNPNQNEMKNETEKETPENLFLNTMSKKLAFSDTLTHEQYSSNPKQFRPYMSSEQSQLISRIESDIVDIVKTAPPKSFLPQNFRAQNYTNHSRNAFQP